MTEAAGYAPTVVEYLKAGWTLSQLAAMDAKPRNLLRERVHWLPSWDCSIPASAMIRFLTL